MPIKISKQKFCELSNLTPRKLQFILDQGALIPSYMPPTRSHGMKRYYSPKNLVEILMVEEMCEIGLRYRHIKRIFEVAVKSGIDVEWDPEKPNFFEKRGSTNWLLIFEARSDNPELKVWSDVDMKSKYGYKYEERPANIIELEHIVIPVCVTFQLGPDYE